MFKWLLVPASALAVLGVILFIQADMEAMRTLRSVAAGVVAVACLLAIAGGVIARFERQRQ